MRLRLQEVLDERNITQRELARRMNRPWQWVGHLARQKEPRCTLITINAICQAIDCEPMDLIEYSKEEADVHE